MHARLAICRGLTPERTSRQPYKIEIKVIIMRGHLEGKLIGGINVDTGCYSFPVGLCARDSFAVE